LRTIIKNIQCLVTCNKDNIKDAGIIENGYVLLEDEIIKKVGSGDEYNEFLEADSLIIDATGKTLTPGLVDSHTHVVYGGSREKELQLKLKNVSYIEILNNGGGILSSVKETRKLSTEELYEQSKKRLDLMLLHGTTTIESKSGYGLNFQDEIKMLQVNKLLNKKHHIDVISTFMGAHAIPTEYKENRRGYIELITNEILPYISENVLAEFIDIFCEKGVFTIEESREILLAGRKNNLKLKIHADELESFGGAELAAELKAVSAEHLVGASEEGIRQMSSRGVIPVLLPATSFYLRLNRYANAKAMIEAGLNIALATDCNPGTSPTESLQTVMTFACFGMGLLPEEIINAMTINAARAVGKNRNIGSIEEGKIADLVLFNTSNLDYLVYHFGINSVDIVIKKGKIVVEGGKIKC
jgi:imidazolonepropionase